MADGSAETGQDEFRPPYISWVTFENFLDRFGENPPPPQIDKTYLSTHSGATQAMLLATLKAFGLIGEGGTVAPELHPIAVDKEKRREFLHDKLTEHYAALIELARQNATAGQMHKWFEDFGYKGSTLRKAVVFYLAAADFAGVPKSPFFKPPKQVKAQRQGRRVPPGSEVPPKPPAAEHVPPGPQSGSGEQIKVTLANGGVVTLNVDARWLDLPDETFMALRRLTKDLQALGTVAEPPQEEDDDDEPWEDDEEEAT